VVEAEPHHDERGLFARGFCAREFAEHSLQTAVCQTNLSFSKRRGTLRGLHLQSPPHAEAKLVRCLAGSIYDVMVDLRAGSPTWGQWFGIELRASSLKAVYIPEGFAHGFQSVTDDSLVSYLMFAYHHPQAATGIRFDDARLKIAWPLPDAIVSDRDLAFGTLDSWAKSQPKQSG
jgi:dTDP-4-dehydrorhamnose 3,5-epimerase